MKISDTVLVVEPDLLEEVLPSVRCDAVQVRLTPCGRCPDRDPRCVGCPADHE